MITSQPMRTSGSECGTFPASALNHFPMIRVMSFQK